MPSHALLIHRPKPKYDTYPFRDISFVNFMPMGLVAMADYATRQGYTTRVLHYGLASWRPGGFDLDAYIREQDPKVIGISLHWFLTSHAAIDLALQIKKSFPDKFIVLGGYTASYFAHEILEHYPQVDGVISGDGEIAFTELCRAISSNENDLSVVRNLVWRGPGGIVHNPIRPTDMETYNELNFARFDLVEYKELLPELHWIRFPRHPRLDEFFRRHAEWGRPFILAAMRGCAFNCTYCGGSQRVHEQLFGRRDPILRDPAHIAEDYREAIRLGFDRGWMNTDPNSVQPDYYRGFFEAFRDRGIRPLLHYEFYNLPNTEYLDHFREVCNPSSRLNLTLETGSEKVRAVYRGIRFSNEQFFHTVREAAKRKILVDVYMITNLPEPDHIPESRNLVRKLRRIPGLPSYLSYYVGIMGDPGCDLYNDPDRFDIELTRKTFTAFVEDTGRQRVDVGYRPRRPGRLPGQHWWWWGYRYPAFLANGFMNFLIYLAMKLRIADIMPVKAMTLGNALFRYVRHFALSEKPGDDPSGESR